MAEKNLPHPRRHMQQPRPDDSFAHDRHPNIFDGVGTYEVSQHATGPDQFKDDAAEDDGEEETEEALKATSKEDDNAWA
jgi:hypothetical protein